MSKQLEIDDKISVRTPSCTKDVNVPGDIESIHTYDHVHKNNIKNTILKCLKNMEMKPRLRRASFLEWISQFEIAFSSNRYTRTILSDYSNNNKINMVSDKKVDLLVYTVIYAFLDKATRMSTSRYKNKGTKLVEILHMKCTSIDAQTNLRAKMA